MSLLCDSPISAYQGLHIVSLFAKDRPALDLLGRESQGLDQLVFPLSLAPLKTGNFREAAQQPGGHLKKHLTMVPSGRKHTGKSGKKSVEDQVVRAYDFDKEDKKDLSGSEEDVIEGTGSVSNIVGP